MRLWLAAVLLAAAPAAAQPGRGSGPDYGAAPSAAGQPGRAPRRSHANPSALVAASIALKQAAQRDGLWKALQKAAAPDAQLLVPEPAPAQEWLKGRSDPPPATDWETHRVWISCDGSLGVGQGTWRGSQGQGGTFSAVWQRQEKGEYRWLVAAGHTSPSAPAAPDMIAASIAECTRPGPPAAAPEEAPRPGQSRDGTLEWSVQTGPDGAYSLEIRVMRNDRMEAVSPPPTN